MTENIVARWDLPVPFVARFEVKPEDIDAYGHVNNAVYVSWMNDAAWAHSEALGLSSEACVQLERGFAVHRHEIDYLGSAYLGDSVLVGTWIAEIDGKLRCLRRFQMLRAQDLRPIMRAQTSFVCTNLRSGRPARMPQAFVEAYVVETEVAQALSG